MGRRPPGRVAVVVTLGVRWVRADSSLLDGVRLEVVVPVGRIAHVAGCHHLGADGPGVAAVLVDAATADVDLCRRCADRLLAPVPNRVVAVMRVARHGLDAGPSPVPAVVALDDAVWLLEAQAAAAGPAGLVGRDAFDDARRALLDRRESVVDDLGASWRSTALAALAARVLVATLRRHPVPFDPDVASAAAAIVDAAIGSGVAADTLVSAIDSSAAQALWGAPDGRTRALVAAMAAGAAPGSSRRRSAAGVAPFDELRALVVDAEADDVVRQLAAVLEDRPHEGEVLVADRLHDRRHGAMTRLQVGPSADWFWFAALSGLLPWCRPVPGRRAVVATSPLVAAALSVGASHRLPVSMRP